MHRLPPSCAVLSGSGHVRTCRPASVGIVCVAYQCPSSGRLCQKLVLFIIAVIVSHASADGSGQTSGSVVVVAFFYAEVSAACFLLHRCMLRNPCDRTVVHIVSIGRTVSVPVHMLCQISGRIVAEVFALPKCIRPFHQLVSFPETVRCRIAFRICRCNYISGMVVDVTLSLTIRTHNFRRTSPHVIDELCGLSHAIRCPLHVSGSIIGEILCASSSRCDTGIAACQVIIKSV